MPIIETLLQRTQLDDGVYVHQHWEVFKNSKQPAIEKSWYAWIQAHAALYREDLNAAGNWLQTASDLLANDPNELCEAEVLTYWSMLWDRVDEPGHALQYAYVAWQKWYAFASNPLSTKDVESIRALLRVLASPEKPPTLNNEELYGIWLYDRWTLQFQNTARDVVSLCGGLGVIEPALEVETQMWEWLDQYLHGDHIPVGLSVVPYEDLLGDVANLYDQVGEKARSLETYKKAVALLEDAIDHPDVDGLRSRLRFNVGNQLAKSGEHEEAIAFFEEAQKDFERQGNTEATLRTKYAQIVSRWKMQKSDGLKEDLEALLIDYETCYVTCESADLRIAMRQNLDSAYRLWLTIYAANIGSRERLAQRFLGQLYTLREGFVNFVRNWARIVGLDSNVNVVNETGILVSRLAWIEGSVLLILESGIDHIVLVTVRSGESSLVNCMRTELGSDAFTQALVSLLRVYHETTDRLINREIAMKSSTDEGFEQACRDVWRELPESIRRDLIDAKTILVSPSNAGNMDEIPVELFHDGNEYLGLTKNIIRVTSLGQLNATLSDNRVNVKPYGKGLILRAAEIADLGPLSYANSEENRTTLSMQSLTDDVCVLREPSKAELLVALGDGVDIMHYIGHGFADEAGEALALSSEEAVNAIDLLSAGPARTPIAIISSCLVGRIRHLRTGKQRGITTELLELGTPAVVAASYKLPDQVGSQFSRALYHHGREARLSDAMRLTRRSLAVQGYHPAVWGAFVIFGHPDATLRGETTSTSVDLAWPTSLCRFMATGAQTYLDATRRQLRTDARLLEEQVKSIDAALSAFSSGDSGFFNTERLEQSIGLQAVDMEAYLVYNVLIGIGYLRFGVTGNNGDTKKRQDELLSALLLAQRMLNDSYMLITLFVEVTKVTMYALTTEEERNLLRSAARALNWLNADSSLLEEIRKTLAFWNERLENMVVFNAQEMARVDHETWALADAGERQAQKLILRNLWTQQASVAAITSTLPWTDWMLRMIGCSGTPQTISDLLGVINESRKKRFLSETEAEALNRLLEQYVGPGEVDEVTAHAAWDAFSVKPREHNVLDLFMIHDQLASSERKVPISEVQRAIRLAKELGSLGAEMYFTSVWCQRAAELGALKPAVDTLWSVLKKYEDLAAQDSEYADRVGITALLLRQLCQHLNDGEAVAEIDTHYMDAMQAYLSKSSEMGESSRGLPCF